MSIHHNNENANYVFSFMRFAAIVGGIVLVLGGAAMAAFL